MKNDTEMNVNKQKERFLLTRQSHRWKNKMAAGASDEQQPLKFVNNSRSQIIISYFHLFIFSFFLNLTNKDE